MAGNPNDFIVDIDKLKEQISTPQEFSTLDEPIWESIRRDLKVIKQALFRGWGLLGPVFICVVLSLVFRSPYPLLLVFCWLVVRYT